MKYRILTTLLGLFLVASPVWAGDGPWNFLMQLPAKDAGIKIDRPIATAIDEESKRYYVVDAVGGTLVSFDRDGKHIAAFNAGGELKQPVAMAKGLRGTLWVIERSTNQLLYVNPTEKEVRRFSLSYPDGSMIFPARLAVDGPGRLLVLDRMRGAVVRLDDNLKVEKTFAGGSGGKGFVDFKVKQDGLWVLDGLAGKVYHFTGDGAPATVVLESRLEFPVSIEIDEAGQLYVLDRHAGTVAVFGPRGDFRFDFLGRGKRHGRLWYPAQLLFDWEGRLCVVDEGNNRVDIFSR
jgi:DNA-binding beta-propeller fold protein YncE